MSAFSDYAKYYDAMYLDKDYLAESAFIHQLITHYHSPVSSLLEIGCGTGRHLEHFLHFGYAVFAIDSSQAMLDIARKNLHTVQETALQLKLADVRTLKLDQQFDSVVALFHVMSYLTSDNDIRLGFARIRAHLNVGGIFIFDVWHGPAVLANKPEKRSKEVSTAGSTITRIAEPEVLTESNIVNVRYYLQIDNAEESDDEIWETHSMRYFSFEEIQRLAKSNNFRIEKTTKWFSDEAPDSSTYGALYILRAI